jgi:hypothetical protein
MLSFMRMPQGGPWVQAAGRAVWKAAGGTLIGVNNFLAEIGSAGCHRVRLLQHSLTSK